MNISTIQTRKYKLLLIDWDAELVSYQMLNIKYNYFIAITSKHATVEAANYDHS
jgi:hypothetical protein